MLHSRPVERLVGLRPVAVLPQRTGPRIDLLQLQAPFQQDNISTAALTVTQPHFGILFVDAHVRKGICMQRVLTGGKSSARNLPLLSVTAVAVCLVSPERNDMTVALAMGLPSASVTLPMMRPVSATDARDRRQASKGTKKVRRRGEFI